jgi:hypothetical protein
MPKYTAEEQAIRALALDKMENLRKAVAELSDFYLDNVWLNEAFDIERLVPMSLDEWERELASFIAKERKVK